MVYDPRLTVSGSRSDKGGTTKLKCVTSLVPQVVTHQTRATTGLERMCDMCDMCDTFFKFLLKNISKHMIISERTFALKSCHTCHTSVELLYILTFSCGTSGTKMSHKWYQPSLSVTHWQNHCISIHLTVNNVPQTCSTSTNPKQCSTNMFHGA
jgi:hypothetical protein